jgi:hypothetical protein
MQTKKFRSETPVQQLNRGGISGHPDEVRGLADMVPNTYCGHPF